MHSLISDFLFILFYSLYRVKLENELLPAVLLLFVCTDSLE